MKEKPHTALSLVKESRVLSLLNQNLLAIEKYNQAIELDPKCSIAYYRKAYLLAELGRKEEALESVNKVVESNPNDYSAYYTKAYIAMMIRNYPVLVENLDKSFKLKELEKITLYENAVKSNFSNARLDGDLPALLIRSKNYYITKDYYNAFKYASKAIELDPNVSVAWYIKGCSLYHLGYYTSIDYLNKAIELDPNCAGGYSAKGAVLSLLLESIVPSISSSHDVFERSMLYCYIHYKKKEAIDDFCSAAILTKNYYKYTSYINSSLNLLHMDLGGYNFETPESEQEYPVYDDSQKDNGLPVIGEAYLPSDLLNEISN